MNHSAQKFCDHVKQCWDEQKVLLFCDNLDAHVCDETKKVLSDGNVFLFCLPPTATEAIQAIDAGHGRSVRCAIGRLLNEWLMADDNIEKWESDKGMTAAERRVLISTLVSKANKSSLSNDSMRIGCFERTGMLLTADGSDDDKIRPQGLSQSFLPVKVPDGADLTIEDPANPSEVVTPEELDRGWTAEDDALHEGDTNVTAEDVVVDEIVDGEQVPAGSNNW